MIHYTINYTICWAVCFQFTHSPCDDWDNIYILCLIIIIKSEVWTTTHCLGLGHETMVCAVCLSIFLCFRILHISNHYQISERPMIFILVDSPIYRLHWTIAMEKAAIHLFYSYNFGSKCPLKRHKVIENLWPITLMNKITHYVNYLLFSNIYIYGNLR